MLNATLCPSPIVPSTLLDRHRHVVQHQDRRGGSVEPELPFVGAALHAHAAFDDEGGELLAVDLGEDREEVGEAAVGDPGLLAVEEVVRAVRRQPRGGPCRQRIRARLRLGERVGADQLAAAEPGQILRLLLGRSEVDDRQGANRRVRAQRSAEGRIDGEGLADVGGADLVETQSAVGSGGISRRSRSRSAAFFNNSRVFAQSCA